MVFSWRNSSSASSNTIIFTWDKSIGFLDPILFSIHLGTVIKIWANSSDEFESPMQHLTYVFKATTWMTYWSYLINSLVLAKINTWTYLIEGSTFIMEGIPKANDLPLPLIA